MCELIITISHTDQADTESNFQLINVNENIKERNHNTLAARLSIGIANI